MLQEVLSLGDKIDIRQLNHNMRPIHGTRTYVSQLIDFVEHDVVNIATPIIYSKFVILEVGEYYNLCFYTNKGLYQCNCVILSNHRENKTIISVVRITTNLEKYQRRQYYRLECIHDIVYRVITREYEILDEKLKNNDFNNNEEMTECETRLNEFNQEWIPGSVIDISGGGARFVSKKQHQLGEKLNIKVDFISVQGRKEMILVANLVASNQIIASAGSFEHRVEFYDISLKDRETLIKYIFEQERKRRKNEMN